MSFSKQDELILKHQKIHNDLEESRKKASIESGKDLNAAQFKKDKALSDDAYPDNAHFIYEIIQNAEDSSYSKNHFSELKFILLNDGVVIQSNQDGFTEKDINSICYMSSGEKIANKDQFIGEKGLGFRSVFKITDSPCISSNGYKFFFDKKQSYEKPFLLQEFKPQIPNEFSYYQYTAIYLPYAINKNEILELEKDFSTKIKPKLILFLKKLNSISIIKNNKSFMSIERKNEKDENFEVSKLSGQELKEDYYIVKKDIDVSSIHEEKRKGITKRELVLAYPKNIEESSNNVFAFLPTEIDSRLNFTIQADFLLDTSRGHILENEWNRNIFVELKQFIIANIDKFQKHSKLKYRYLKYFLQETKSNNKFIDNLYAEVINESRNKDLILSQNETWQKPQNILLLEDNLKIETKYLKILFGQQFEQIHEKFELNDYFIDEFDIKQINREELLNEIYNFLDKHNDISLYKKDEVLYFTKIIAKYLNFGRDARKFDEDYFQKIKKALPIIPKYKSEKNFYLYDAIYISSEYEPDILIENMCKEASFDFSTYNFLSEDYLDANNKNLENFIRKIIEEQQEHKNRKTLDFFTKYPEVLQNYLKKNIQVNYPKILDFLIANQEGNIDRISNISLLLTQKNDFKSAKETLYFSNESDTNLEILNSELWELVHKSQEYKEFLTKVFKVKEADILNIILNEYLPWIEKNSENRNEQNDTKLLEYTKAIIENFSKFENEQKENIKKNVVFISSNNTKKYRKSSNIYLPQEISQIIFGTDSIDKYISDKSIFEFLDETYYNKIFNPLAEEAKIKEFFKYFSFEKNIKDDDVVNFIKYIKKLDLEENVEALKLIVKSIGDNNKKIDEIRKFKVYSQKEEVVEIEKLFLQQVDSLDIDFLHKDYKEPIKDLSKSLKQYFLSEYNIEPFITYLKNNLSFEEAINVYKYLEQKKPEVTLRNHNRTHTITTEKIRQKFKADKLIYNREGNRYFPSDVTWKEEKSNTNLYALSQDYPGELHNFFVKIVQVSQTKDIRQIIDQIKDVEEKNNHYFDLLIDLNDLVDSNNEIDKYHHSYDGKIEGKYDKNIYENAKQFILKDEQIFILDNDKKNKNANFYFNDLNIEDYSKTLKEKIFSVNEIYPIEHYSKLIDTLNIQRLSKLPREYSKVKFLGCFSLTNFRSMLHFAYDLLFTKFQDEYKKLQEFENNLRELNEVEEVKIYDNIIVHITIDTIQIEIDSVKYYIENKSLYIVNEKDLFKIISENIGFISDKDIRYFYSEVIKGSQSKEDYYSQEEIKEKQNFSLHISDVIPEEQNTNEDNNLEYNDSENNYNEDEIAESEEQKSEEEKRKERKSGTEQIGDHERDVDSNSERNSNPSIVRDTQKHQEEFSKNQAKKIQTIVESSSISEKTKNKIKNESSNNTKDNNNPTSNQKMKKFGDQETKNKFKRKDWYSGQCQICGFTFQTKNGFHCERFTWTDLGRGSWTNEQKQMPEHNIIDESNSLCLCSRCHSILKHGGQFSASFLSYEFKNKLKSNNYTYDNFIKDIEIDKPLNHPECFKEHIEWEDMYFLEIKLNNNEEHIYFTEEHLIAFFTFLKS
jgi:hypothetical protein